jgi:rhomboid protease GluP
LEIGLWVVALNSLVLLFVVARRSLRAQAGYAILLAANLALSAGLLVTSNVDSPLAFVSIGAFVFMVLLPPIVDRAAHRAVTAERMKLALTLSAIRELLQPGAEARQLRRALNRLARVRGGEADEVIAELSEKIGSAEGPARLGLQMQKLSVILYARRWSQAIEYFEDNLPFEITAFNPTLAAGLIRAYGETGRLDRMAHVSASLEDSPGVSQVAASEPLAQARMIFLAFCGRHDALLRLLEERSGFAQSVEPEMREVWIGIAFKMDGRKKEARAHLERAHRRLKGPSARRELKRHLDTLDELEPPVDELSDEGLQLQAEKVLERASVQAALPRLRGGRLYKIAPVTAGLVIVNVIIWLGLELVGSGSGDPATLIAAGANLKPAVKAGDYYRLVSSLFLHAHIVHLGLNMLVLAILGRLAEQLVGSARFFLVFVLSGVAGSGASLLFGEAPLSVGASGSIFGVLGAMVAALWTGRGMWPDRWRKSLMTLLLVLGGLSLLPGVGMDVIDNWAHLGGLIGGAVVGGGAWLGRSRASWVRWVTVGLVALVGAGVVFSATQVAIHIDGDLPWRTHRVGRVEVSLPASWVLIHDEAGLPELQSMLYRARIVVSTKAPMGSPKKGEEKTRAARLLDSEVDDARREASRYGAVFAKKGAKLVDSPPKGWMRRVLHYEVNDVKLAHAVFVRREMGGGSDAPQRGGRQTELLVVHLLAERAWVEKEGAKTINRFLKSVKTLRR